MRRLLLVLVLCGCAEEGAVDPSGRWSREVVLASALQASGEELVCGTVVETLRLEDSGTYELANDVTWIDDPGCPYDPEIWTQIDRGRWVVLDDYSGDTRAQLVLVREERRFTGDHPQAGDPPSSAVVEEYDFVDRGETPSGDAWLLLLNTGLYWEVR